MSVYKIKDDQPTLSKNLDIKLTSKTLILVYAHHLFFIYTIETK